MARKTPSNLQGYADSSAQGQVTNIVVDFTSSSDSSVRRSASEPSIASSGNSKVSNSGRGPSSGSSSNQKSSSNDGSNLLKAMSMQRGIPQTISIARSTQAGSDLVPGLPAKVGSQLSSSKLAELLADGKDIPGTFLSHKPTLPEDTYLSPQRVAVPDTGETWLSPGSDPQAHADGECKPCSYFFSVLKPCSFGDSCKKCHLPHERSRRHRPSKSRRESCRRAVQELNQDQAVQVLSRVTSQTPSLAKSQNNYVSKLLVAKLRGEAEGKDFVNSAASADGIGSSEPSMDTKVSL